MADFLGHEVAIDLSYRPRSGQWVLFHLKDKAKQVALVEAGAHAARDGSLVSICAAAHNPSPTEIKRADGTVEVGSTSWVPDRLMLVDADGNNFSVPVKKAGGHGEWVNVFFYPASPNVVGMRPLDDLKDLPPGYTPDPNWRPRPDPKPEAAAAAAPPMLLP